MRTVRLPTDDDLAAAARVVAAHLRPTPLIESDLAPGLLLKLETFQPTGSFKVRGALAALGRAPAGERVVTASAGNHGLGIAWAAGALGRDARIVVPETASPAKVQALQALGADLVQHGRGYEAAERHALGLGGHYVSAYNDTDVIAGQATIGRELPGDAAMLVVCPVGGGGLLAGLQAWARRRDGARVAGVEAQASLAVSAAVRAGRIVQVAVGATLADGLAGNLEPGSVTPQAAAEAAALTHATEDEIRAAVRALARRHGIVAEGAGATALAAVLAGRTPPAAPGERTVVVVTGRNIALVALSDVLRDS